MLCKKKDIQYVQRKEKTINIPNTIYYRHGIKYVYFRSISILPNLGSTIHDGNPDKMTNDISSIIVAVIVLIVILLVGIAVLFALLNIADISSMVLVQEAHGIQVKKCSFWVFLCHMEEHYTENCEVGKWLKDYPVTHYVQVGSVMVPFTDWYNVYEYTCYREYDNGTQTTIVSTKDMPK